MCQRWQQSEGKSILEFNITRFIFSIETREIGYINTLILITTICTSKHFICFAKIYFTLRPPKQAHYQTTGTFYHNKKRNRRKMKIKEEKE
jgi:hypothetical protein